MDDRPLSVSSNRSRAGRRTADSCTLVLTRADIVPLLPLSGYVDAVETGFRASARGAAQAPPPLHLASNEGGFHAKAALLEATDAHVAVKINSNFPHNPACNALPTIQGSIALFDARDGRLLALMDSIEITLRRTAAASALAARFLARRDSASITMCGCGEQARAQLAALAALLPLRRAFAWDRDTHAANRFAAEMTAQLRLPLVPIAELRSGTLESDVIVTSTTAQEPFLGPGDVRGGTFVAAVGADHPGKNEIEPELMKSAAVYVDVLEQCRTMGDLHHAIHAGAMTAGDVRGDLAALVVGASPGRGNRDEITLFDSTGTAIEDVAVAVAIYEQAMRTGAGTPISFGGFPP